MKSSVWFKVYKFVLMVKFFKIIESDIHGVHKVSLQLKKIVTK